MTADQPAPDPQPQRCFVFKDAVCRQPEVSAELRAAYEELETAVSQWYGARTDANYVRMLAALSRVRAAKEKQ